MERLAHRRNIGGIALQQAGLVEVAGDVKNGDTRPERPEMGDEFGSIHTRHDGIHHHKIEVLLLNLAQGVHPVCGRYYLVPGGLQPTHHYLKDEGFIVDDQYVGNTLFHDFLSRARMGACLQNRYGYWMEKPVP
jgi:hypothetical protein